MNRRPPIQSMRQRLPFHDGAFGWDTFEDFFCDFLNAQPVIVLNDAGVEIRRRVIRARPFGRKGDSQHGIDLLADMEGGEVWDFQCKHYKVWGPEDTRDAIAAYDRDAPRRFLLVTRDVSEECKEVVAAHPNWALWDAREINRRLRELDVSKAAPVLFTHFGPGWAEAFFGVAGDGPLIGAEAKFERQLIEGHRFHHRHSLIGRTALLEQLDGFVRDEKARVFIVTGRGGLGKSRLLLQWSRAFNHRHPDHTLRFLSDKCGDFGPSLQSFTQPLTLVFDDAHRLDDVRRALFHELPRRERIKLVLSLRPGPIGQVMQELLGAGFDTTEIITAEPMKSLTSEQAMQLVDAALKPEFSKYRHFVRSASRDCPLIAVVGAELINAGVLTSGDLLDETELQRRVFESLLDDARPVRESFGPHATDDFLRLLALLGPVKLDAAFFAKAAPFLGMQQADRVSHLRDALDGVGLLHTTGAGTRVTPDLLSDHLAYTACYDHTGQSRTFAERLLGHFSPEEFPKLMQHLAEAEWRALDEKPDAASVVEPLWQWFRARFEASSFYERKTQLGEWANIAHLQPARSLELAELAVSLTTAPSPNHPSMIGGDWDTHSHLLSGIAPMLQGVAEYHPEYVARCFDVLWQLGRDLPSSGFNQHQSHPLGIISQIVAYKHWKSVEVHQAALNWLEHLLSGDDWDRHLHQPGWLLEKFFEPMLATSVEESWSSGRTAHFRSHPLHLENTALLRERLRSVCRTLLARRDPQLASQLIPFLDKGCDIARMGFGGSPSAEFCAAWDGERLKCLSILEDIIRDFDEPLLHFQVSRGLMHFLHYGKDSEVVRPEIRRVIDSIPSTLDFHIARAVFGNDYDELEHDIDDDKWQDVAKAKWQAFVRETVDEVRAAYPAAADWLAHFVALDERWRAFESFQPNFRSLLVPLCERDAAGGIRVAERFLSESNHALAHTFDAVAMASTTGNPSERLRLIRTASTAKSEELRACAVACCTSWRRESDVPEDVWLLLESAAPRATKLVADRIVNFVWWNDRKATIRDWHLLASLPFTPSQSGLAGHIAARAADLVSRYQLKPDPESVARFLRRFESLENPEGRDVLHALGKLAEVFPLEIFLMLWRRNQTAKIAGSPLKPLPYEFINFRFPRIMSAPEVQALVAECEQRLESGEELDFDELRLLRAAIQHGSENPSAWLEAAAARARTEAQLHRLRELGSPDNLENAALTYPSFGRALLTHARTFGQKAHEEMFNRLLHVGGGRSSTNGEPDDEWKALVENLERLADRYTTDPELGPLFTQIAKGERSWMSRQRPSFEDEDV